MGKKLPHVTQRGSDGLPLVFLHSLGGSRTQWARQLEHFSRTHRALAFDLLGHGANPTPWGGVLSFDRLANDVITTANHLGLRRLVLVGHSFGAAVAISCAAKTPGHVVGLVLADPVGRQQEVRTAEQSAFLEALESERYEETVQRWWRRILQGATTATQDRVMADLMATPREVVSSAFRAMTALDPVAELRAYPGPRLSITTPLNDSPDSLHRLIPDLPHRQMTGTSHWLQMDRPDEFNALLTQFLVDIDGR